MLHSVLDPDDGSTTELFGTADWAGLPRRRGTTSSLWSMGANLLFKSCSRARILPT